MPPSHNLNQNLKISHHLTASSSGQADQAALHVPTACCWNTRFLHWSEIRCLQDLTVILLTKSFYQDIILLFSPGRYNFLHLDPHCSGNTERKQNSEMTVLQSDELGT